MKKDFELKTERLTIKPMGMVYIDSVHKYATDVENTRYMLYLPNDSRQETEEFLSWCDSQWEDEESPVYECAIILDGKQIGAVSLENEDGIAELGWIIEKNYWGRGYAVEAARTLTDYAINTLGIKHFIAHCDAENVGSFRTMEKLGMKLVERTGGRKNKSTPEGEDRDELTYRLDVI